jgi:hypothetical protein
MSATLQELSTFLFAPERCFLADEEELLEGGVGEFLESIRPRLELLGVHLTVEAEQGGQGNGYSVVINGQELVLYTQAEDDQSNRDRRFFIPLTPRLWERVNQLFTEAGSMERLYCLGGWNDMSAIFLTQDEHKHVCSILEFTGYEIPDIPYLPGIPL